jgi:hypothetical protein
VVGVEPREPILLYLRRFPWLIPVITRIFLAHSSALRQPYITSPRSLEACKVVGVEPRELILLPMEYFLKTSKTQDVQVLQMRYQRFETIR